MLDIVLVEDDARLGTMVSDYLQRHGYQVSPTSAAASVR